MSNARHLGSDRESMLRRVAIVLSSLPAPVAAKLLGSVGPESKQDLRRTMTSLADVDPLERRRALQAFKTSVQQQPNNTAAEGTAADPLDEILLDRGGGDSRSSSPAVLKNPPSDAGGATPSPLSFLGDVEDDTLVRLLAVEHPQAVALVLASIAPPQAARVLPRLEPSLRTATLSRIGRLAEIPEAAASEVAQHFRVRLQQQDPASTHRSSTGKRALDAILAAMPATSAAEPATEGQAKAVAFDAPYASQAARPVRPSRSMTPVNGPANHVSAIDSALRLRVAEQTRSVEKNEALPRRQLTPPAVTPPTSPLLESTDAIHQHLARLSPRALCRALGRVETRVAMLALCGLPNSVAEAALAVLPRQQAKTVRANMTTLGSLNLREIDEAKERVARASLETVENTTERSVPVAA